MTFFEQINNGILTITDPLFGWLLHLPSDLRLLVVAVATSLLLKGVRAFTTDQSLLRRVEADKKRLGELIKQARAGGDMAAVKRFKANKGMVALRASKQELMPLLVAIIPLAMLATWAWSRLEFHPPRENDPVDLILYTPASAVGQLAHVVPAAGVSCDGYLREITPDAAAGEGEKATIHNGIARWTIRAAAAGEPHEIIIRCGSVTVTHPVLVGQPRYSAPLMFHADGWATELKMEPVKLFRVLPGIPAIGFAPWLVAYLLIVIVMMPVTTRLTGIR